MTVNRTYPEPSAPIDPDQVTSTGRNAQESDREMALRLQNEETYHSAIFATQSTIDVEKATTEDTVSSDEEYAKKVQQEEEDRAIAVRLQQNDREGGNAQAGNTQAGVTQVRSPAPTPEQTRRWKRRRLCNGIFLLLILGGGTFCVLHFGDSIWARLTGGSADLPPFFRDKWGESNSTSYYFMEWNNDQKGLELEVVNALTEDWDNYFNRAVNEWNQASALDLSTRVADKPDPDCTPVRGLLKVCNDAYGFTGWTGLNQNIREGRYITYSVAKLNESYLKNAIQSEKQYVMCHEIGHGFGLPHRDEQTNNPDLGTCLDYTVRPQNNMSPDEVDFDNLKNIYGEIRNGKRRSTRKLGETLQILERQHGRLLHYSEYSATYEEMIDDDVTVTTTVYFPLS